MVSLILHVCYKIGFVYIASDETFSVEDIVERVGVKHNLGGITNQLLVICETDAWRRYPTALIVNNIFQHGDDFTEPGGSSA